MIKKTISFYINLTVISFLFILLTSISSALSITEIELNPIDSDAGNEWLELHSEDKFNLEGYYLQNEDGDKYNLSGNLEGYFIVNFEKQWLDNSKTIIYLKKDSKTIFQTPEISDSKNDDLTLNLCNNSFILIESSKGERNNCPLENNQSQTNLHIIDDDKLFLNNHKEEKLILSKDSKIRLYLAYFFTFFSTFIIILIYLRKL